MDTLRRVARLLLVVAPALFVFGCPPKPTGPLQEPFGMGKDYDRPLPPGQLALRKITDPADIPDFTRACGNPYALEIAIDRSLSYLSKPSSRAFFPYGEISHEQAVASLKAFRDLLDARLSPDAMNAAIREKFDVYISVGCDDKGTVLYTGYYTPIFDASPTRTERFRWPLYKQPADLVKDAQGNTLGRRGPDGQMTPFPDRKALESSNQLAGLELYWLGDPFEVYIAHVQGSAKLRLPDGKLVTVGYTANSGHEYRSIGKEMLAEGKFPQGGLSLRAMIDYFKAHPGEVQQYTWRNPRFVFFGKIAGEPRGSLNEPVMKMRSIATDKTIFPRACLAMISTNLPRRLVEGIEVLPYEGFALDQDTGGAIRAPGRCDVYMGVGDEAGDLAGRTMEEGRLYYLFLKPSAATPSALPVMGPSAPGR